MRLFKSLFLLLASASLTGCMLFDPKSKPTAVEQLHTGIYQGHSESLLGKTPYRLLLTLDPRNQQANGVLTNLSNNKIFSGSGSFKPTEQGGYVSLKLYENGKDHRANMEATLKGQRLTGKLSSILFGQQVFPNNIKLTKYQGDKNSSPNAQNKNTPEPVELPTQP